MLVFIDSSILCTDFYMKGMYFDLLKKSSTIVLSEIVVAEVKNKHKEMILENLNNINKGINSLNSLISKPIEEIDCNAIVNNEQKAYEDFIDMFIIESGLTVAEPYPTIEHSKIVERALERKKPFKSNGKDGYRDYLVWHSFLNVAKSYSSENVCFITLNKKDFSDEKNQNELHPDLIAELDELKIDKNRFQYWTSLKDFVDTVIIPIVTENEKNRLVIDSLLEDSDNFSHPLEMMTIKKIIGMDLSKWDVLLLGEKPSIKSIDDVFSLDIIELSKLSENEYLIEAKYELVCTVDSSISKSDLVNMDEDDLGEAFVVNSDYNDKYALIENEIELEVIIKVIFDTKEKSFSAIEISELSDNNCPYCPY